MLSAAWVTGLLSVIFPAIGLAILLGSQAVTVIAIPVLFGKVIWEPTCIPPLTFSIAKGPTEFVTLLTRVAVAEELKIASAETCSIIFTAVWLDS